MGALFKPPKPPSLPPPPSPVEPGDLEIQRAAEAERRRRRRARGRASTILTGGAGLTETAPTDRKTLLGG